MAELNQPAEPMPPGAFYSLMGGKLGVPKIRSGEDLASLVEKRLPATAIRALVRGGLSDAEAYHLIVPRMTLAHRIAKRQPLSKDEADKAVRVARIAAMAEIFLRREHVYRAQAQGGRHGTSDVHVHVQRYAQRDRFRLPNLRRNSASDR